jgi:hypothetical protein
MLGQVHVRLPRGTLTTGFLTGLGLDFVLDWDWIGTGFGTGFCTGLRLDYALDCLLDCALDCLFNFEANPYVLSVLQHCFAVGRRPFVFIRSWACEGEG